MKKYTFLKAILVPIGLVYILVRYAGWHLGYEGNEEVTAAVQIIFGLLGAFYFYLNPRREMIGVLIAVGMTSFSMALFILGYVFEAVKASIWVDITPVIMMVILMTLITVSTRMLNLKFKDA